VVDLKVANNPMRHINRDQIPESGVSHDAAIRKHLLIPNGVVPKLTNFSQSVLQPGQLCPAHSHPDMYEIYLVESGEGVIVLDGKDVPLRSGDCLVVKPGEEHSMQNRSAEVPLHLTYFGIEE
jgi:mannose-6-phosphate isomerase-like protein (cupin superfamily)